MEVGRYCRVARRAGTIEPRPTVPQPQDMQRKGFAARDGGPPQGDRHCVSGGEAGSDGCDRLSQRQGRSYATGSVCRRAIASGAVSVCVRICVCTSACMYLCVRT